MFCPLYSEARLAGEKRRDFSTELGKSTQNTPTYTKSEPVQSRLHYLPEVKSSQEVGKNLTVFATKAAFCLSSYPLADGYRHGYAPS